MNENDFNLLCESIRQAGEIRRGVRKPARTFVIEDPNPKAIRERLGLSQSRFASIIGVSVRTLQNWEHYRIGNKVVANPRGLRRLYSVSWIGNPRLYYTHSTQSENTEGPSGPRDWVREQAAGCHHFDVDIAVRSTSRAG